MLGADVYLYLKEKNPLPQMKTLSGDMPGYTAAELDRDYDLFYELRMSILMRKNISPINIATTFTNNRSTRRDTAAKKKVDKESN